MITSEVIKNLNFYFIVTKSTDSIQGVFDKIPIEAARLGASNDMTGPQNAHLETLQRYKDLTGVDFSAASKTTDELSLLLYDSSILVELLKNPPETSYSNDDPAERQYDPVNPNKGISYDLVHIPRTDIFTAIDNENYTTFYTKTGKRVLKVMTEIDHQTVVKVPKLVPLLADKSYYSKDILKNITTLLNMSILRVMILTSTY